jgi:hypothetical protein
MYSTLSPYVLQLKVKFCLCLIIKHYAIDTGGMEV